jgi:MFS family permease
LVFVAFPLLAARLTRNPVLVAGVAFAATLPWLTFALPAGALADRVSRRRLLTRVETARLMVLAILGFAIISHHFGLAELYVATFLVAMLETAFDSATTAVIPQIAVGGDLVRANSQWTTAQLSGEQFIGPALGGLAVAAAASVPVFLDAASFAVSAVLLSLALKPRRRLGRHGPYDSFALAEPPSRRHARFGTQIREGLAWLMRERRMRLLCSLNATFAFCQALGVAVLVIYCTRVLHLSAAGFGVFTAIASSGNTIGAWVAPRVHARLGAGKTLVVAGVVAGAGLLGVGLTSSTVVAVAALGAEGTAVGIGRVTIAALRQQLVPLALAGRVSAALRSAVVGAAAAAALVGGGLVALFGPHAPFAIGGTAQVLGAVTIGGLLAALLASTDGALIDVTDAIDLREQPVEVR